MIDLRARRQRRCSPPGATRLPRRARSRTPGSAVVQALMAEEGAYWHPGIGVAMPALDIVEGTGQIQRILVGLPN